VRSRRRNCEEEIVCEIDKRREREREGKKLRGQRKTTGCLLKEREGAVWMMAFSVFGSLSLSLARCCPLL